jgi:hypothetical protein
MDHISMGGIDDANNFKGMQQYKETRDKVVPEKEYVRVGRAKWALKVFDPCIGYHDSCLATRPYKFVNIYLFGINPIHPHHNRFPRARSQYFPCSLPA